MKDIYTSPYMPNIDYNLLHPNRDQMTEGEKRKRGLKGRIFDSRPSSPYLSEEKEYGDLEPILNDH